MQTEVLEVEIQVSKNGSPWKTVSTGFWRLGVDVPLELHGEALPETAINDLFSLNPHGHESGCSKTKIGDVDFQMNFRRC